MKEICSAWPTKIKLAPEDTPGDLWHPLCKKKEAKASLHLDICRKYK